MTTVIERNISRVRQVGDSPSLEKIYRVHAAADHQDAVDALLFVAPLLSNGLWRQTVHVEPDPDGKPQAWIGRVSYGRQAPKDPTVIKEAFSTLGGTQKIQQSLETLDEVVAEGGQVIDYGGAIGCTDDGIEGVDITVPKFTFEIEAYIAYDDLDTAAKLVLAGLTGKTNAATFHGHAAGTVLFLGVSGELYSPELWQLKFHFAVDPGTTRSGIGELPDFDQPGWAYAWFRHRQAVNNNRLAAVVEQANVERVYDSGDFSVLPGA